MAITLNGDTGITSTGGYTGDGISFADNTPSNTLVTTSGGNVGIGTSSPSTRLDIRTASGGCQAYFANGTSSGYIGIDSGFTGLDYATAGEQRFRTGGSYTERMRIDSSGNVLVGTTTKFGQLTSYNGSFNASASGAITTAAIGVGGGYGGGISIVDGTQGYTLWSQSSGADFYIRRATTSSTYTGGVYISNAAGSWSSASDERLKNIIRPIDNALGKILEWRCIIGEYKDNEGAERPFLIAQDVQKTFPEAVNVMDEEKGYLGLSYTELVPLLTKAIQEQQAIIEQLKADVELLKGNK